MKYIVLGEANRPNLWKLTIAFLLKRRKTVHSKFQLKILHVKSNEMKTINKNFNVTSFKAIFTITFF